VSVSKIVSEHVGEGLARVSKIVSASMLSLCSAFMLGSLSRRLFTVYALNL